MESEMFWSNMSETCSSSSEDETGSSYSDESDESSLRLEDAVVCGKRLALPQGLCEQAEVFKELVSMDTWLGFTEQQRQHLKNFLPSFPENDSEEKNNTLRSLFARENIRFGNPLTEFHKQLKAGHYRPDINKMRRLLKRAQYKEYKHQQRRYYFQLMKSILVSRHRLLEAASRGGPGTIPRPDKMPQAPPRPSPVHQRVRRRYFQELAAVREEVGESSQSSDDENYPEGPPAGLNKKQKRQLASLEHSLSPDLRPITSTLACKPSGLDLEQRVTPSHNPYDISDDAYREMLIRHRKRRLRGEVHPNLQTKGITTNEVLSRSQVLKKTSNSKHSAKKPKLKPVQQQPESLSLQVPDEMDGDVTSESETIGGIEEEIETEKVDVEGDDETPIHTPQQVHTPTSVHRRISTNTTPNTCPSPRNSKPGANKAISRCRIKLETPDDPLPPPLPPPLPSIKVQSPVLQKPAVIVQQNDISYRQSRMLTPATLSDLDGIDMMDLPVDLEEPDMTFTQADIKPELTQETHACFFSLLRDIICSTPDHRMSLSVLEDSVKAWTENPISPLNDWYHLATADISGSLSLALNFLSGDYTDWQPDEFVPYLEYKSNLQAYQWIGAGRDTDAHLTALCRHWLERREDMAARVIKEEETAPSELDRDRLIALTPPPPRCPTTWTVTASTPEEREDFREQERIRYENPHKAFTYRMHGYESVVGPVKGMYCQTVATNKPRGHSLLNVSRPNYVTILALVRDATARLPNGQGTRSDICTLLRDSQYLIANAPDADLNSVVSGALDRLHYECDPCVKYETKLKTWIYLHRGRTEEEAERMHQEQQRAVKPKNSRKAYRAARALAQTPAATTVQVKQEPVQNTKPTTPRPPKTPTQRIQVTTTLKSLPDVNTVIKVEPGLETEEQLQVVKPQQQPQQRPVVTKQNTPKSTISAATLAAAAKKASLAAQKQLAQDPEMKSIMGKTNRKIGSSTKAVKNVQNVKTETGKAAVTTVRRIPDKSVGSPIVTSQSSIISAVRHIPDAQIPATMPMHTIKQKTLTPSVLSAVRVLPDSQAKPTTTVSRVKTLKAVKEQTSLLEQNVATPTSVAAKKKMTVSAGVQATADPTPVLTKVSMAQAKSLVKMITTQAAVRNVQSPTQVTSQQMMLIKQAQQQFLNEQSSSGGKQQQLIVMKQSTDTQTPTSQPQMIVINQQQIVTDQQLTAKQHKQLQQLLVKQQYVEQQPQQTMAIQQQQLQQLILAKQQQMLAEQQKTGKPQQQMIVLKQQPQQQQVQVTSNQQTQDQQKAQQLQQMILVKQQQQQQQLLTGEPQQITQQQLQQMLLMKQQQQQASQLQQQQQMILVKQQSDQKVVTNTSQVQTKNLVQQQSQTQAVPQQLSLAQLQQLQQQQQRVVSSSSLLSQPRVVAQVGVSGQAVSSASTSLIKPSQPQQMLAKMVTNAQGQPVISMESLLAHQKQHGSLPQGALRVATASGKPGLPPQYTVVSVAQPRVIQATQLSQATSTTVAVSAGTTMSGQQSTAGKIVTTMANQGNQIRMSGINLAHIGGKPVLLASKPQSLQAQNVILASQGTAGGQTVLLASQGLRGQPHTGAQGTLTVLQQGGQQILLPPGFHASTLNIKTLQGLKVIPLTPAQAAAPNKGTPNRQQLFARILNPGGMRPVVANIVQTEAAPPNPPSTTE